QTMPVPVCVPASGSVFSLGTTEVTCTATDAASNSGSASFDVTVTDDEDPVFGVANNQSFEVPLNAGGPVTFVVPTATDNSGTAPTVVCNPVSGSTFTVGSTEVSCTATDVATNSAQVSFFVQVATEADTTDPVLVVPAATVAASTDVGEAFATVSFVATATDDGPAGNVSVVPVCVPASGSQFVIGDTTVTCTATDGASNSVQDTFVVTVTDDENPTFAAAATQNFQVPLSAGGAVTFVVPAASDNSGVAPTVVCDPLSGSVFAIGTTEVTCTATDAGSNSVDVSFDVVVTVGDDTTDPVLVVPTATVAASTDVGEAFATVSFVATATDDGPAGNVSVVPVCVPASGSQFVIGDTTVTCTATDGASNSVQDTFTVTVADDEDPTFAAAPDQSFEVPLAAGGVVTFVAPTASDNSGVSPTVVCAPLSGSSFAVGSTEVTCTATDIAGNTGSVAFDVILTVGLDTTTPVVTVPGAAVEAATLPGETTAVVTFAAAATDTGPTGTIDVPVVCVPASGTSFAVGDTVVTCTATDGAGNSGSESFTVSVTATPAEPVPDTVPPVIELPGGGAPVSVETEPGASFAIVTFEVSASDLGIATAAASSFTDVDEPIETAALTEIEVTCTPASGSRFSIGTTTVECSATDAAGNTGTASFEVRVSDVEPPKLTAPDGDRVRVTSSVVGPVDFPVPTVEDNSGEVVVVCDPAPGSNFDAGTTTVTCTATDSSGNESTVSFGVEVELRDPNTPGPSGDLPATGGGGIDLRPAWIVLAVGLLLLVTSRRRRRLRVLQH
ncbi:MAG: HYR domain-containing protein, partial [Ilumatobacter sp.]